MLIVLVATQMYVSNDSSCVKIVIPSDTIAIAPKFRIDSIHINTATARQLKQFGFSYYELYSILSYRDAGGKIRNWNKLSSIYGIDTLKLQKERILYDDVVVPEIKRKSYSVEYGREYKRKEKYPIHKAQLVSLYYADSAELCEAGVDLKVIDTLLWYRKNYIVTGKMSLDTLQMATAADISDIIRPHLGQRKKGSIRSKVIDRKKIIAIELNSATIQDLCDIKYVAEYSANKIVSYKKRLGGYVSVEQLKELPVINQNDRYDQIVEHLEVNKNLVSKLKINSIDLKMLKRHPYVTESMCGILLRLRRNKQRLNNIDEFKKAMAAIEYNTFLDEYLIFE